MTSVRTIKALWHLWRENVRDRLMLTDPSRTNREIEEHNGELLAVLHAQARIALQTHGTDIAQDAVSVSCEKLRGQLQLDEPPILRVGDLCSKTALPPDADLAQLIPRYRGYLLRTLWTTASRLAGSGGPRLAPDLSSSESPPPTEVEVWWLGKALTLGAARRPASEAQERGLRELVDLSLGRVKRNDLVPTERADGGGSDIQARNRLHQRHQRVRRQLVLGVKRLLRDRLISATLAERLLTIVREHFLVPCARRKPVSGGNDPRSGGHHG